MPTHESQQKHTPEPWGRCGDSSKTNCSCGMIWSLSADVCVAVPNGPHWESVIGDPYPHVEEASANVGRIISCVNALASIPDPAAFVKATNGVLSVQFFPAMTATTADAIAFEIEEGDNARHTTTAQAKAAWLRGLAKELRSLGVAIDALLAARKVGG